MTEEKNKLEAVILQSKLFEIKKRADSVLKTYKDSPTYTIEDSKGSVSGYKYFLYPFKNFSIANPKDEEFIAKHLASFIDKDVDLLVTFEADGIGITKLISVVTGIPMLVCKTFHYHQEVIEFQQRTGYFERTMYCPKLIENKKIAIIDCIASTGGTIKGLLNAIKEKNLNVDVEGIYAVVNKTNYHTSPDLFDGIKYKYLFNVLVEDDGSVTSAISDDFRDTFWREVNNPIMQFARRLASQSDLSRNNFKVGPVVVDSISFEILGWGFKDSLNHAEANALKMAQENFDFKNRLITVYTTLEPCVYRTIPDMPTCDSLISSIPEINWVVIDKRDTEDDKNLHQGIEALKKSHKYVVCFEDHPSIALNYTPELSKRKEFFDESKL